MGDWRFLLEKMNYIQKFKSRDEEIRLTVSEKEAIRRIEEVYQAKYNPSTPNFEVYDQLLACEAVVESTPFNNHPSKGENVENGNVNGNDNGSYKRQPKFELTKSKSEAISNLKKFNCTTSRIEIAKQLEIIFQEFPSKEGHWLKVAQYHTPRQINWSISRMLKLHYQGRIRNTPAAFFTYDIMHRKPRKDL